MELAQRLKQEMENQKMTVYRLSKEAKVHQTTIANILDGAKPQAETLKKIAGALGVEKEYLLGVKGKAPTPEGERQKGKPAPSSAPQSIPFSRAAVKALSPEDLKDLSEWINEEMNRRLTEGK